MRHDPATTLLYCLVKQQELDLIAAADWLAFPPCRPDHALFYPVLDHEYAAQLAPYYGGGYVLRFAVDADYAAQFPVRGVGDQQHEELRVPAEELAEFNRHIVGQLEIVAVFQ